MLELIAVKKKYKTKAGDTAALNGVSLHFPDTGLVFITGKSGSGKTTLLNIIGGLDGFDSGEIKVQGKGFSSFSRADFDSYRNTFVGFIFQEYNLLPEYSVRKNVALADELQGKKCDEARVERLFKEVEIEGLEERKTSQLSGGQKQRVAIVRALVKSSKIILADELTGALDSVTGAQVMDILKKLSKEKLVIVVSHDLEIAEKYADRIIRLVDGKVVEDVTLNDVEIDGNIRATEDSLTVKKGSSLSWKEQMSLVSAIKKSKRIEFTDKLSTRERTETPKTRSTKNGKEVKLIRSKMKFFSALSLGVKALFVKPWRLLITVVLSVVAFACFGVLDAIASFTNAKAIEGILQGGYYSHLPLYATYTNEYYDGANLKISQERIDEINQKTGYQFRGVYDLSDAEYLIGTGSEPRRANFNTAYEIQGLPSNYKKEPKWASYYRRTLNGMVAFSQNEIEGNIIDPDGFGYTVIHGRFPTGEDENGVAISSYTAECILQWANFDTGFFGGKKVEKIEDLLESKFTVADMRVTVTGIVDCGKIPEKYDALKEEDNNALGTDFNTYISSGCYLNFFVDPSMIFSSREQNKRVTCYYTDYTKKYEATVGARVISMSEYYCDVQELGREKVVYFDGGKASVKENEVLINIEDLLDEYFYDEMHSVKEDAQEYVSRLYSANSVIKGGDGETIKEFWNQILNNVKAIQSNDDSLQETFKKQITVQGYTKEGEKMAESKQLTVVGAYFGIETGGDKYLYSRLDTLATSKENMEDLHIPTDQGIYSRIISPLYKNAGGEREIGKMMDTEEGIEFRWYQNSILETVERDREMMSQFLDLFLYAAIVLALFSVVMLFNYISVSILSKKQSVGVLRALGANNKNIFTMFLAESLIICLINGILGCIVSGVACVLINDYLVNVMNLSFRMAVFGLRQIGVITAGSVLAGLLSSIIPIIKIAREKPVNLIRKL